MEIFIIILFNVVVYGRTLYYSIVIDDIKNYSFVQQRNWKCTTFKKFLADFQHRLYGGATFGINTRLDHALSIFLHTCICVLIYMVFGYSQISFFAAMLYVCNPVNHQTSLWLNGRRYAINIILVLFMMLYSPWSIFLYPLTFFNHQVAALFAPILIKGLNPLFLLFIPLLLAWKWKAIKARIDSRMSRVLCQEQKEFKLTRIIIIIKSYGFYFFNMFMPVRIFINYPNLFWWGITKEKNALCHAINLEFFKGILSVVLSIAGLVYFQGYMRIMCLFMILSTLQWSAIFSAVQVNADRYISLPNVFMMYFLAYFINMTPAPIMVFLCIMIYYLCQLSIGMVMYKTIDSYQRYQMFFCPFITKPRFNRIEFYFKQKRFLTAWYLIEEGLQFMPNDFHLLFQAAVALSQIGNLPQALEMLQKAKQNFYLGQEGRQGGYVELMEKNIKTAIAQRKHTDFVNKIKKK